MRRVIKRALEGGDSGVVYWGILKRLTHERERLVLCHLVKEKEVVQFYPQELWESLDLHLLHHPCLLLPFLEQVYRHLLDVHGYKGDFCALQSRGRAWVDGGQVYGDGVANITIY